MVVRDPRDGRQFRPPVGGGPETLTDRAVIPRGGRVDAQNPYFVIASADEEIAAAQTGVPNEPRSRIRVNFQEKGGDPATVTAPTNQNPWVDLAPRPFASFAQQNDPNAIVTTDAAGSNARILDLLAMKRGPSTPSENAMPFTVQTLNPGELTTLSVAGAATTAEHDLFVRTDADAALATPPTLEILLQTRLNPLRAGHFGDTPGTLDAAALQNQERDNPWITVDRMRTVATRLDLFHDHQNDQPYAGRPAGDFAKHFQQETATGPQAGNEALGPKVSSRVRRRPLLRASELAARDKSVNADPANRDHEGSMLDPALNPEHQDLAGGGDGTKAVVFNSLGGHDANAPRLTGGVVPRPFDLWQPHFDRPFAGPADLAMVPLYDAEHLVGLAASGDADGGGTAEFTGLSGDDRQIGLGFLKDANLAGDTANLDAPATLNRLNVAASRLLYPDVKRVPWQSYVTGDGSGGTERFNMWYRLLQHVGTPRTTAEMIAAGAAPGTVRLGPTAGLASDGTFDLGAVRDGGKINLNTLATPEPFAGLLDDTRVHGNVTVTPNAPPLTSLGLPAAEIPAGSGTFPTPAGVSGVQDVASGPLDNDWFRALLLSRDGVDPLVLPNSWGGDGSIRLVIPGVAHRRQFDGGTGARDGHIFGGYHLPTRDLASADVAGALRDAIQSTPLRARPGANSRWVELAPGATNANLTAHDAALPRAFFGIGGADLGGTNATANQPDLNFTTRYRLLNKVLNNATHRGETFLCWIQIEYHHAREIVGFQPDNTSTPVDESRMKLVRIGAKRDDSPGYRAAFLIDRSRVPELLQAGHLPGVVDPDGSLSQATPTESGDEIRTYSFARDPLSGGSLFPWRDLVIHRQRIR